MADGEPLDLLPAADHQERVAHAQPLVLEAPRERLPPVAQPDHRQPVAAAEGRLDDRLAGQLGVGRHHDLGHADVLRAVAEIGAGEGQRVERELLAERHDVDLRREQIDEQDVLGLQLRRPGGRDDVAGKPPAALDGDQVGAAGGAQVDVPQGLAHQRRPVRHAQPVLAVGELVPLDPVAEGRTRGARGPPLGLRRQPAAGEEHVGDAQDQDGQAERGEAEELKPRHPVADELGVDDEVRRRPDQGHHAADEGRHGERHHELAGGGAGALGDPQGHGNEDGHHARGAHEGAEPGHRRHQQDEQSGLAAARLLVEPVAQPLGDPRAHQTLADDEERSQQHDGRIAEAGQRLAHGDHAREGQHREHDQPHGVHARLVDGEHRDGRREQDENDGQIGSSSAGRRTHSEPGARILRLRGASRPIITAPTEVPGRYQAEKRSVQNTRIQTK